MTADLSQDQSLMVPWFIKGAAAGSADATGLRLSGGGGHQSKTMMLAEVSAILGAAETRGLPEALVAVQSENLLGKSSTAASESALKNLGSLYSLKTPLPVTRAMLRLWPDSPESRPLLALLCALARDPILRDTAHTVLSSPLGSGVGTSDLIRALAEKHQDRFSFATFRSLGQNCAATWTQSGHLSGRVKKVRTRVDATPESAAFAAFIAQAAGFGGPAILTSPWMTVLDASPDEQLGLLRRAQGRGLVRVRHAGAVFELQISPELAADFA